MTIPEKSKSSERGGAVVEVTLMKTQKTRGQAIIETALLLPWIIFLFVGVLDVGFFSYAAITTQNAARIAALANSFGAASAVSASSACLAAVPEMNMLPNTRSLVAGTYCASPPTSVSASSPIAVTATTEAESDGTTAAVVTLTYYPTISTSSTTPFMIPIPGILIGPVTITRTAKAPILNSVPTS